MAFLFIIFLLDPTLLISSSAADYRFSNETDRLALLHFRDGIQDPSHSLGSWNDTLHFCQWQGVTCSGIRHPQRVTALDLVAYNLAGRVIYLKLPKNMSSSELLMIKSSEPVCESSRSEIVLGSSLTDDGSDRDKKYIYFYWFAAALGVLEIFFIASGWWYLFRNHGMPPSLEEGCRAIYNQFRSFTYAELIKATHKFKEELGSGGSGSVYKGVLDDDRVVAVKKLGDAVQGGEEFWAEVSIIGKIYHMNLVRLWGFCPERVHKLLVYEYVENGSLDKHLFCDGSNTGSTAVLGWKERFKIAVGTAKGLAYLHHECLEWVIHCDMKPENILLDLDFEPKIADFGLAKLSQRTGSGYNFSHMRGTKGYMAPEWASNEPITAKADVYSYGVVLLEVVKGIRLSNWVTDEEEEEVGLKSFVKRAKEKMERAEDSWVGEFVDSRLKGQLNWKQAARMVELGVSCVEDQSSRRPTMEMVVQTLLDCLEEFVGEPSQQEPLSVALMRIDLSRNAFHGAIPGEIGRLFRLQYLILTNNTLSGEIPGNLTHCSQLMHLYLNVNKLVGSIPAELGSLPELTRLHLGQNNLTGAIPPSLGNLSSLHLFYLSSNALDGKIPADQFSRLMSLEVFAIAGNQLSGNIPDSVYNISSIQVIHVIANKLHGSLPPQLGFTLPNLQWLSLSSNQFTGPIPISLPNATYLEIVQLSENGFRGPVPNNLGSLQHLRRLIVGSNQLGSGKAEDLSFLVSLTNCSNLTHLAIEGNGLGGALPASIANLSINMRWLGISNNLIFGNIPSGIGELGGLTLVSMENNMLTGTIPPSVGKLHRVVDLSLSGNELSGEIPDSLCNMTQLSLLTLHKNNLVGSVPSCLENCRQLQVIRLYSNNFWGTLPKPLFRISSLNRLLLQNNSFSGSLPLEVGRLLALQGLDVSNNELSGEIPTSLGDCLGLEILSLGGNLFQGSFPTAISSLRGLRYLDLSRNLLSGKVPKYLEQFHLEYLNLSFNNFEGELPTEGVFRNFSAISVFGNSKLCGGIQELHLPACIQKGTKKTRISHATKVKVIIIAASLASIALSCFFICLLWLKKSRKKPSPPPPPPSLEDPFLDVSYAELLQATDGFSSTNLIGAGGYGTVYKGLVHRIGTTVAVKVLNLLRQGALKSFMVECEALRNIRHRNLVKILTCCSSVDFKGNEFKALVFEYMPNGSLDKWLHKDGDGIGRNLKLIERLNIAIDVASALDYLHCHCQTPIIHRDLKPSNVLLDADMVAHVGDFGLSRFTSDVAHSSSVGVKGSTGYAAPEYAMGVKASPQGDAYSYGILLLEMITGKEPTHDMFKDNITIHNFVKLALPDGIMEIADPQLVLEEVEASQFSENKMHECLSSMARIGVMCSLESPRERMEMNQVIAQLHAIRNSNIAVCQVPQTRTEILGEVD
ncbi:hypothetical protein ACLOJK_012413 [Asimina triloba]